MQELLKHLLYNKKNTTEVYYTNFYVLCSYFEWTKSRFLSRILKYPISIKNFNNFSVTTKVNKYSYEI